MTPVIMSRHTAENCVANEEPKSKRRRLQRAVDSSPPRMPSAAIGVSPTSAAGCLHTQKVQGTVVEDTDPASVPAHPLGLKPLGNALGGRRNIKQNAGHFSMLPDEIWVQILELVTPESLLTLGQSCRALYAFCSFDELWKTLFIQSSPSPSFEWRGSWRATYLQASTGIVQVDCSDLYSDVLHRPFQCANLSFHGYARNIPDRNAITRLSNLSAEEFSESWSNRPFILTNPVKTWQIFKLWSLSSLLERYGDVVFRAESLDLTLRTYLDYMRNNCDESPLYLFDCHFAEKMALDLDSTRDPSRILAYDIPSTFNPDLFTVLDDERPHHRWLIAGCAGSGSTFHADPNGTSAWNAVIKGAKYWLMFPPPKDGSPPDIPGVHLSADLSHITAPLSLSEYMLSFHAFARQHESAIEAVCHEGEILYVPAGWYHMVVNLEEGIAVTQNFVSPSGAVSVLSFMRDRTDQVSGFRKSKDSAECSSGREFELFKEKLQKKYLLIFQQAMDELSTQDAKKNKKSKWDEITGKNETVNAREAGNGDDTGFSFGFGFDEDDIDEE